MPAGAGASLCVLSLAAALALSVACSEQRPIVTAPSPTSAVLLAAGDIGECGSTGPADTGSLLDTLEGTVLAVGDLAYPSGTAEQFRTCYEAAWGRHKYRTYPAPGNHEYETQNGQPYFNYFGSRAGLPGLGYYSFKSADWLILSLNSNVPADRTSTQWAWVRAELMARNGNCSLAYFHHPLYSSGPNGDNPRLADLWDLFYEFNVDVVISAHDHMYERFARIAPTGQRDQARGIRQFIAGTGGALLYTTRLAHPSSEFRLSTYGILKLTLERDGYSWDFIQTGGTRADSGFSTCH